MCVGEGQNTASILQYLALNLGWKADWQFSMLAFMHAPGRALTQLRECCA